MSARYYPRDRSPPRRDRSPPRRFSRSRSRERRRSPERGGPAGPRYYPRPRRSPSPRRARRVPPGPRPPPSPRGPNRPESSTERAIRWNKALSSPRATSESILDLADFAGARLNAVNVATAIHRLGRLGKRETDARLRRLLALARERIGAETWEPRHLSNVCWGLAKMGVDDAPLFGAVATAALAVLDDFNDQAASNTVWSFATAGEKAPALFDAVARWAAPRVATIREQALTNMLWAFAHAGAAASAPLFAAVADDGRALAFSVRGRAIVCWAFATVGAPAKRMLERIADEYLFGVY